MAQEAAYAKAAKLGRKLEKLQVKLDRLILEISASSETSGQYWTKMKGRITGIYNEMRIISNKFLESNIPRQYQDGLRTAIRRIKNSKFAPGTIYYKDLKTSNPTTQGIAAILNEAKGALATGYLSGNETLNRMARLTQQVNVNEKQINKAIERGYNEGGSPQSAKKRLRDTLLKKAKDGKTVTVIDKNGNTIQYKADYYAEMVTRTKLIEASTQATINAQVAVGGDLVQVSTHNTNCNICAPYEGKIYSLSGANKDFPPATDLPPYHPNCQHVLLPVYEEGLKEDGTYEKYSDFSKGKTGQHPTRKTWTPVSERELV